MTYNGWRKTNKLNKQIKLSGKPLLFDPIYTGTAESNSEHPLGTAVVKVLILYIIISQDFTTPPPSG